MKIREFVKKSQLISCWYISTRFYLRTIPVPQLRISRRLIDPKVSRLGGKHGWNFLDRDYLRNATIISVGLGEDASFDTEFCRKYAATVVILDPTPKAIKHFQEIGTNFGNSNSSQYSLGGKQPINSYNLVDINSKNFKFIPNALWTSSGETKFYLPKNESDNSYSITNSQSSEKYIQVKCTTYLELLEFLGLRPEQISLIKLDIEGAASEVICDILSHNAGPRQILVEFEEIFMPSIRNYIKIRKVLQSLERSGYKLKYNDRFANFLFEK